MLSKFPSLLLKTTTTKTVFRRCLSENLPRTSRASRAHSLRIERSVVRLNVVNELVRDRDKSKGRLSAAGGGSDFQEAACARADSPPSGRPDCGQQQQQQQSQRKHRTIFHVPGRFPNVTSIDAPIDYPRELRYVLFQPRVNDPCPASDSPRISELPLREKGFVRFH